MKKTEFREVHKHLISVDRFRNDGQGRIFEYIENKGVWVHHSPLSARQAIEKALGSVGLMTPKELKDLQADVEESTEFIETRLSLHKATSFIACKNCLVDLETGKQHDFDKDKYLRHSLNFVYNPQARIRADASARMRPYLQRLLGIAGDLEDSPKFHLLLEILVYAISDLENARRAFILLGPAGIGKSVLLDLIEEIAGADSCTRLTWGELGKEFYAGLIKDKSLVLSDEMPCAPLRHLDRLKSIITGGRIVLNQKFGQISDYRPCVKLISAANTLPTLGEVDAGGAFMDRICVLALGTDIPENKDPHLREALLEECDDLFSVAVQAAPALIKKHLEFTEDDDGEKLRRQLLKEGLSISAYVESSYNRMSSERVWLQELYEGYLHYCDESFLRAASKVEFRTQLIQLGFILKKVRLQGHKNPVSCVLGLTKNVQDEREKEMISPRSSEHMDQETFERDGR